VSNIVYKKLFELRILHGYLLDHWHKSQSGRPLLFQEYSAADQLSILENKYDIRPHLRLEPDPMTKKKMENLRMQWRATPTGLIAGIEVEKLTDGRYKPKLRLLPGDSWAFVMKAINPNWYNMTNHALRPALPARYYFDNRNDVTKVARSLSAPAPLFNAGRTWEMGELANIGGTIQMAGKNTSSASGFMTTYHNENVFRWVNGSDRSLLPKTFTYHIDPSQRPVTQAVFTLETLSGTGVKTLAPDLNPTPDPDRIVLDFRYKPTIPGNPKQEPIQNGWYNLKIQINGGVVETRRVMLHADVPSNDALAGMVVFETGLPTNPMSLLDADGALRATNGQLPYFEIHWPTRQTYWRYHLKKIKIPVGAYVGFSYDNTLKRLDAGSPRRLSVARVPAPLTVSSPPPNNITLLSLPNPEDLALKLAQNQYISELYL
jgi:hypothetical protein